MTVGRLVTTIAAATVFLGVGSAPAFATPAEGDVERADLARGTTDAPISIVTENGRPSTLLVQSLTLKPGSSSGWHTHAGPEYSVITEGTVALQTADQCAATSYTTGQAVFIPAGVPHRVANEGVVDADVVVNYTLPADAPARGDSPDVCQK
jgi:quercetin dioxygenase-like cupin family protein